MSIVDGQSLPRGVKLYLTPGHAPGTISLLIPVPDKGRRYLVDFHGGSGMRRDRLQQYAEWNELIVGRLNPASTGSYLRGLQCIANDEALTQRREAELEPLPAEVADPPRGRAQQGGPVRRSGSGADLSSRFSSEP